jgi:hypothetical protein
VNVNLATPIRSYPSVGKILPHRTVDTLRLLT